MSDKLEIYKIAVDTAENVSSRRMTANGFFVTINTALVGFLGILYETLAQDKRAVLIFMSAAGIALAFAWFFALRSYKRLNKAKYDVIHKIEKDLPYQFFDDEWELLKRKKPDDTDPLGWRKRWIGFKDRYTDLSNIEALVPIAFGLIYLLILVGATFKVIIK